MAAPRRNIELKASDPDPERSLAVVLGLGARDRGLLRQRDTYFRVATGRLKLREEEPGGAMLIQYDRVDADEARESRYRLIPVDDPKTLCAALEASLGTLAVVEKERHLLLWQNVRIHLDRVKDLGDFVELEGVADRGLRPRRTSSSASPASPRRWRSRPSASCATPTPTRSSAPPRWSTPPAP